MTAGLVSFFSSFICPYSVLFLRNILSRDYRILTNKKFGRKRKGHHPAARGGDAVKANENQSTHLVGNRKRKRENTRRRRRQRRTGFSSILFSFFLSLPFYKMRESCGTTHSLWTRRAARAFGKRQRSNSRLSRYSKNLSKSALR